MQYFILVATVTMITETLSVSFPISLATIVKEKNSFNPIMQFINRKSPKKVEPNVKQTKINKERLSQSCTFYPIAKNPESTGSKCRKKIFC